ncbi:complement C1q-like protein 2 [Archocentrus centrarchus]|uniref:complement C1q-like protein 2 n=1 Tax=Archocentrus centrarchus TaxID=63155 RepID=UPI0011EA464E|nr:complement C1q-like protein 2 [Archocentrus centrarchus]
MMVTQQSSADRMKIIVFSSLLLLVCSVSADQTETESLQQTTANQHPCLQDIHAVLRELTASLAVLKEQISVLQRENQDHENKLKEVERQKTEIEQLKQQLKANQVAFSAAQFDKGEGNTGPFNTQTTLTFKHVVTNIGNAYNSHTGMFTAPVRGAYHFEWHIYGHGDIRTGAYLFRNGDYIFSAYEHPTSGGVSGSNGASLLLEVGDQVYVRLWDATRVYDNQNHHNTFSGHLIFTM